MMSYWYGIIRNLRRLSATLEELIGNYALDFILLRNHHCIYDFHMTFVSSCWDGAVRYCTFPAATSLAALHSVPDREPSHTLSNSNTDHMMWSDVLWYPLRNNSLKDQSVIYFVACYGHFSKHPSILDRKSIQKFRVMFHILVCLDDIVIDCMCFENKLQGFTVRLYCYLHFLVIRRHLQEDACFEHSNWKRLQNEVYKPLVTPCCIPSTTQALSD